ncbi:MAG: hypothetical protein AB7G06_03090 [Bdellovibrionales bacterium]
MSDDLTWHQQQRRALGLPFDGKQPPAIIIALQDAANPHLGLEKHALFAAITDHHGEDPRDLAEAYLGRIAAIIRRHNLFDELERPVVHLKCVPSLDADGTFPPGQIISTRELDWMEERDKYIKPALDAKRILAGLTLGYTSK